MKKLLFIFALFLSGSLATAQKEKLNQLFDKYEEAQGVTSIKIAKPMFNMLNKLDIDDGELDQIKPLLSKINSLKILIVDKPELPQAAPTAEQTKQINAFQKLQTDISSSLKNLKYEELITVNSKDNKIKFLSADATNGILDDLLLSINSEKNTVLLMLDGKISMDDVNNLVNETEKQNLKSSITTENINSQGSVQVRRVGKFSGVAVSGGIKVNFTQGKNQSVVVETEPDLQEYVSTEIENGILVLYVNNSKKNNLRFRKLTVTIEAPELSSVKVSSGSTFSTLNTVEENNFQASLNSGANLNANLDIKNNFTMDINSGASCRVDLNTTNFEFDGSSGSMATFTGNTENAAMKISSAATINAHNLKSKNTGIVASSAANAKVNASANLSAVASSGASIRYAGNPKNVQESKTSSGGRIKSEN